MRSARAAERATSAMSSRCPRAPRRRSPPPSIVVLTDGRPAWTAVTPSVRPPGDSASCSGLLRLAAGQVPGSRAKRCDRGRLAARHRQRTGLIDRKKPGREIHGTTSASCVYCLHAVPPGWTQQWHFGPSPIHLSTRRDTSQGMELAVAPIPSAAPELPPPAEKKRADFLGPPLELRTSRPAANRSRIARSRSYLLRVKPSWKEAVMLRPGSNVSVSPAAGVKVVPAVAAVRPVIPCALNRLLTLKRSFDSPKCGI